MNILERELSDAIIRTGAQTEREEALLAFIHTQDVEMEELHAEVVALSDQIWGS